MINEIKSWREYCNLPLDAEVDLINAFNKLTNDTSDKEVLLSVVSEYENDINCDLVIAREKVSNLAKKVGVHEYTAYAVMYILFNKGLKNHYIKAGYPLEIYNESVKDVSFHMRSTKLCDGVWGTYTAWHNHIYKMGVLGFGRLQFQPMKSNFSFKSSEFDVVENQTYYLNIHIPRTQTPLDEEECEKSLKWGVEYFKDKLFGGGKVLFHCQSWLLFEKHDEMLKPTSNIYKFKHRFTITDKGFYPNYNEIWRLFDMYYTGNPDDFNANSSLRKAYVELLKKGEPTGWGRGVFYRE